MNNEIEVGEYVRSKSGVIIKADFIDFERLTISQKGLGWDFEDVEEMEDFMENEIVKHSKNKIDLVENGDYVNGWKVLAKTKIKNNEMQVCILTAFEDEHWITINNETLKFIVTEESFKEREYVF